MTSEILEIGTQWQDVEGEVTLAPQDRATLGELRVVAGRLTLTEAWDSRTGERRIGAHLSAHRLAEWLVWNWWRLRWEPAHQDRQRLGGLGWRRAHELASIGGGWLWPNIAVVSDGLRIILEARATHEAQSEPLRYMASGAVGIPAPAFEAGIDAFVERVLARLKDQAGPEPDLLTTWRELCAERRDPELTAYRRIEACLGHDVDAADPPLIEGIIADGVLLGSSAMMEVAADGAQKADELRQSAATAGFSADADNAAGLQADLQEPTGQAPWAIGINAAKALRNQEKLGEKPISNGRLAELCGTPPEALRSSARVGPLAFALREGGGARMVLRAKTSTGRRFELARLLGDRCLISEDEPLRPATRASTYRQKAQRAFAGEFLCPIDSLTECLAQDFSEEAREAAADYFNVSPLAVTTLLVNHGLMARDDIWRMDAEAA